MGKLSVTGVKAAKRPGRFGDGDGLFLVVGTTGSKSWVCRVQKHGRRRDIGLGSASKVTLSVARDRAREVRTWVELGLDPVFEKRKASGIPTFREATAKVYAANRKTWRNEKHEGQWLRTLEAFAFPIIGDIRVSEITGPMIRNVLAEIWLTKPETARRVAELDVEHEDRLYPTPDAFPEVEDVVQRAVLEDILELARQPGVPLIVHAAGGMGKTVLLQGLADRLRADGPVVLFDGFGAGRWRDPADNRHLPERTLVHLANLLSGEGLCDILLPIADVTGLLRAYRRRLAQSVATARNTRHDASLSLVLDAIDHAGLAAQETATQSFAHLLLRSISVDPIDGVRLVASCRTERIAIAAGDSAYG